MSPAPTRTGSDPAALTVTVIVSQSEAVPSETQTSKVAVPTWPAVGVQVKEPPLVIEAPAGTEPPLPLARLNVRVVPGSGSLAVAVNASWVPTWALLLPTGSGSAACSPADPRQRRDLRGGERSVVEEDVVHRALERETPSDCAPMPSARLFVAIEAGPARFPPSSTPFTYNLIVVPS